MQCPKCQYQRQAADARVNQAICPACGIVYAKWLERQHTCAQPLPSAASSPSLWQQLTDPPKPNDAFSTQARALTLLCFAVWGGYFISGGVDWQRLGSSFMHQVNLPFHEFGHVLFLPLGRFMTILGGSLFQLLLPFGLMWVFILKQRDNFAASLMLWWCGQSFIDLSPYIDDAQYRALPLIGGAGEDSHDWGNLLTELNLVESCHRLARGSFATGSLLILLALGWGGLILKRAFHQNQKN